MSIVEIIGVALSILGVVFTVQKKIIAWYINIISSIVYGYLFFQSGLYADAELQVFFIVSAIYGIIQWSKSDTEWKPSTLNKKNLFFGIILSIVCGIFIGKIHQIVTVNVSLPYFDGILTASSIYATYLAAHQKRENWIIWMVVDSLYVIMYLYKDLYLTAGLYGIFVVLACRGFKKWN